MSTIRTGIIFEEILINISNFTLEELDETEKKLKLMLNQIIEKLITFSKNLNFCYCDGYFVLNDEYLISKDIREIIEAFGFEVTQIQTGLKGNTYIFTNEIIYSLMSLNADLSELKKYNNFELSKEFIEIMNKTHHSSSRVETLYNLFQEFRTTGMIRGIEKTEYEVTIDEDIKREINRELINKQLSVESKEIGKQLEDFKSLIISYSDRYNQYMVNGTKKIIESRAKSLGYTIKETKKNDNIELVLVRYN